MKAQQAYQDANSGLPPKIPNDIFQPSDPEETKDELSIFSGKAHTLTAPKFVYQPDYQRQHFDKQEAERLEREREEAANREMEIQEMERHEVERQELARQQQLHQQREMERQHAHEQEIQRQQQHELLRQQQQAQQQQLDIRRQREKHMQDQYRQQLEVQQHQLQQRQPPQYHLQRHPYDDENQPPMLTEPDHGMVTSSSAHPAATPNFTLSHSHSQPNIHQAYQQRSQHHYQPMHHPDTAGGGLSSYAPPSQQRVTQRAQQPTRYSNLARQPQQQHSMYAVPPEYSSPDSTIQTGISYVPPTPISPSYIPYWSAASNSFAMPDQQATTTSVISTASGAGSGSVYGSTSTAAAIPRTQIPEYQQHQQYTPEGALRGIAADDRSLQETWQSYMNKVPPQTPNLLA